MISLPFRRSSRSASIDALYGMIVAQARSAEFYRGYGVPDTVDGRLDMIVLHLVLVLRQLTRAQGSLPPAGQQLFDRFCADMDDNFREMGVGDFGGAQAHAEGRRGVLRPRQGLRERLRRHRSGGAGSGGRAQCVRRGGDRRWARAGLLPICARRPDGSAALSRGCAGAAKFEFPDPACGRGACGSEKH